MSICLFQATSEELPTEEEGGGGISVSIVPLIHTQTSWEGLSRSVFTRVA